MFRLRSMLNRDRTQPPHCRAALPFLLALLLLWPAATFAKKEKPEDKLAEQYRRWLTSVELIMTKEERALFLAIEKDYQRDAFIEAFWKARNKYAGRRNSFRDMWEARLEEATALFGGGRDARYKIWMLQGPPTQRIETNCLILWPIEVWFYSRETLGFEALLVFYQRWGLQAYRTWEPLDGLQDLSRDGSNLTLQGIADNCGRDGDAIAAGLSFVNGQGKLGAMSLIAELERPPKPPKREWVASFSTYSTDLPEDATPFEAPLDLAYPGNYQARTVLQASFAVPTTALAPIQLGEHRSYNLLLTGEFLREGKLFENFRYKYDVPVDDVASDGTIPVIFQRNLRPGSYTLVVRIEDINSKAQHRTEQVIEVPEIERAPPAGAQDPETRRILAEANAAIASGENTIKFAPFYGDWQTGLVRIDALTTGQEIAKVTFLVDGQPLLTKKRPPYSVELDLGTVPRSRVLRAEAFDAAGETIASDELTINAGKHRFAVRLTEPRRGKNYTRSLQARAEVIVPENEVVERVEFYLNETLVATLYQPPYIQPMLLPEEEPVAYVRAVAYTPDENATEDLVFVNAPGELEEIDVDYVELYTAVLDNNSRPVEGLTAADFTILEDGVRQEVLRFEQVRNLPIHAAVMLDVSASMVDDLAQAQTAALRFFEQIVTPKDRATVVTFNDHPHLTTSFTNDVTTLAGGLAGLKAERGTSLYDSLIFTLYYFNGIKGQRAVVLLSDGKDENSRFDFDTALEYAQRAGVALYTIGLNIPATARDVRRKLNKFATETGGRSFYIDNSERLDEIYSTIQRELRSRYLVTYQSANTSGSTDFRTIEVKLSRGGLEAKTLRGYFP